MEPISQVIEANSPLIGFLNAQFNLSQGDLCTAIFGDNESQSYWGASEDLNSRGQLALHILLKNLPTPKDHIDEVVKRVPYMQSYRTDFYRICRGTREPRPRCALCGGCWFGYNVARHKVAHCPIARNIEHQKHFWMINTPAACNLCAGRSLWHKHKVKYTQQCIRCGRDHQEWMKVCDLLPENPESAKETLVRIVEMSRLEHYNRVKSLAKAGKLGFWLVNDRPLRHPRKAPGFPSFKDSYKNYPPIRYRQKKFPGIQHGAANPPALSTLVFTDQNQFSIWNNKFRSLLGGQNLQGLAVSNSKTSTCGSCGNCIISSHGIHQILPSTLQNVPITININYICSPTAIPGHLQMLPPFRTPLIQNPLAIPNLPMQIHTAHQIPQGNPPPEYRSPFRPLPADVAGAKLYEQRERAQEQRRLEIEAYEANRVGSDDQNAAPVPDERPPSTPDYSEPGTPDYSEPESSEYSEPGTPEYSIYDE